MRKLRYSVSAIREREVFCLEEQLNVVHHNRAYYELQWGLSKDVRKKNSWNWAAFFLTTFWFAYRKMYALFFFIIFIIQKALDILKKHQDMDYYAPDENEKLYWKLRDLGEIVDFITEDTGGRWTCFEGVVVKFEENEKLLYLKLVKEVGKTESHSDGDYIFTKVIPKEKIIIEWV